VKTINITEKTGALVAIKEVTDNDDLMIITKNGIAIRLAIATLRVMGRATQGVKLINLRDEDSIAAVTKVDADPDEPAVEVKLEGEEYGNQEDAASTENPAGEDEKGGEDNGKEIDTKGEDEPK
jgi:DNA gyrase subunit A